MRSRSKVRRQKNRLKREKKHLFRNAWSVEKEQTQEMQDTKCSCRKTKSNKQKSPNAKK